MMSGQAIVFVALLLEACSLGVVAVFFISTMKALKKFNGLDSPVQDKLLLLEYYMAVVRNLSKDDLALFSKLPDEAIQSFNMIQDYGERIQTIRKKITAGSHSRAHISDKP
jgi:hypothetical protein